MLELSRRAFSIATVSWLTVHLLHAQQLDRSALEQKASGLPPQFAAALLLQAASEYAGEDQVSLLRIAFSYGERAPDPFVLQSGVSLDSLEAKEVRGSQLGFDRLSLQARSVSQLLALDSIASKELFSRISLPHAIPSCSAPGYVDLSSYYSVAADIADRAFTAKERDNQEHVLFAQQLLNPRSSAQLGGAILFATRLRSFHTVSEKGAIATGLAQALRASDVVDVAGFGVLMRTVTAVSTAMQRLPEHSQTVRDALVVYVKAQARSKRCGSSEAVRTWPNREQLASLNRAVCGPRLRGCNEPLTASGLASSSFSADSRSLSLFWRSTEAKRALLCVDTAVGTRVRPAASESSQEKEQRAEQCLDLMDRWPTSGLRTTVPLHELLSLVERLIQSLGPGTPRFRALQKYLTLTDALDERGSEPGVWLLYARRVPTFRSEFEPENRLVANYLASHPGIAIAVDTKRHQPEGKEDED